MIVMVNQHDSQVGSEKLRIDDPPVGSGHRSAVMDPRWLNPLAGSLAVRRLRIGGAKALLRLAIGALALQSVAGSRVRKTALHEIGRQPTRRRGTPANMKRPKFGSDEKATPDPVKRALILANHDMGGGAPHRAMINGRDWVVRLERLGYQTLFMHDGSQAEETRDVRHVLSLDNVHYQIREFLYNPAGRSDAGNIFLVIFIGHGNGTTVTIPNGDGIKRSKIGKRELFDNQPANSATTVVMDCCRSGKLYDEQEIYNWSSEENKICSVISASQGNKKAYSRKDTQSNLSKALKDGLEDGETTLGSIHRFDILSGKFGVHSETKVQCPVVRYTFEYKAQAFAATILDIFNGNFYGTIQQGETLPIMEPSYSNSFAPSALDGSMTRYPDDGSVSMTSETAALALPLTRVSSGRTAVTASSTGSNISQRSVRVFQSVGNDIVQLKARLVILKERALSVDDFRSCLEIQHRIRELEADRPTDLRRRRLFSSRFTRLVDQIYNEDETSPAV